MMRKYVKSGLLILTMLLMIGFQPIAVGVNATSSRSITVRFTPTVGTPTDFVINLDDQNPDMTNSTLSFPADTKGVISFVNMTPQMIMSFLTVDGVTVNNSNQTIEINRNEPYGQLRYNIPYKYLGEEANWTLMLTINQPSYAGIIVEGSTYSTDPAILNLYAIDQSTDIFFGSRSVKISLNGSTGQSAEIRSVKVDGVDKDVTASRSVNVSLPPISTPENDIEVTVRLAGGTDKTVNFQVRRTGVSVQSIEYLYDIVNGGDYNPAKEFGYIGGKWAAPGSNHTDFVTYVAYSAHSSTPITNPRLYVTYYQDSGSSSHLLGSRQFNASPTQFSGSYFERITPDQVKIEYYVDSASNDDVDNDTDRLKMTNSVAFYEKNVEVPNHVYSDGTPSSIGGSLTQIMVFSTLQADIDRGVPGPEDFPGANRISVMLLDTNTDINLATDSSFTGIQYGIGAGVEGLMVNNPNSDRYEFWQTGEYPQ